MIGWCCSCWWPPLCLFPFSMSATMSSSSSWSLVHCSTHPCLRKFANVHHHHVPKFVARVHAQTMLNRASCGLAVAQQFNSKVLNMMALGWNHPKSCFISFGNCIHVLVCLPNWFSRHGHAWWWNMTCDWVRLRHCWWHDSCQSYPYKKEPGPSGINHLYPWHAFMQVV